MLLALALAAAIAACGGANSSDTEKTGEPQADAGTIGEPLFEHAGTPAPDVTLERLGGGPASLASFRGTPTLVNLWATWCAPCIAEMPALDRLAEKKGYALNVVAVSQDIKGGEVVEPFLETAGIEHLTVLLDKAGALPPEVGAPGLPVTIMYDGEGRELWRVNGPREWDEPGALPAVPRDQAGEVGLDAELAADGVAFVARGQEPGWIVRITPGGTVDVEAQYGETSASFPAPATIDRTGGGMALDLETDTHSLALRAAAEPCADPMSGREYPLTVIMTLDEKAMRGCGQFL